MLNDNTISVGWDHYCKLVEDSDILHFLKQAGVDSWEGYDEAMQAMENYYSAEEPREEGGEGWYAPTLF